MQSDKTGTPAPKAAAPAAKKTAVKAATKKASAKKTTTKKTATKKAPAKSKTAETAPSGKKKTGNGKLRLRFEVFFSTKFGEQILISGAHPVLGAESAQEAPVLEYMNDQKWAIQLELDSASVKDGQLSYTYMVRYADGTLTLSAPYQLFLPATTTSVTVRDAWNAPGFIENVYGTDAIQAILGEATQPLPKAVPSRKKYTHRFIITAPPLEAGKAICLTGEDPALGSWDPAKALMLTQGQGGKWHLDLSLKSTVAGTPYKYGIYDLAAGQLESFESGDNRVLEADPGGAALLILQNGFIRTN